MNTKNYIKSVYTSSKEIESSVDDFINNEIMKLSMGKDEGQSKDDALKYILAIVVAYSGSVVANGIAKNTSLGYSHKPVIDYLAREINGSTLEERLSLSLDRMYDALSKITPAEKIVGSAALSLSAVEKALSANKNSVSEPINPIKTIHRNTRGELFYTMREADSIAWREGGAGGVLVELNPAHPKVDMCDELAGLYPIDFVFYGWHPSCMCIATPVSVETMNMPKEPVEFYSKKEKWYKTLSSFKLNNELWEV